MHVADLPQFPWDTLTPVADLAAKHPGGMIDLSVGTPVDPTPPLVQAALQGAADSPGYPTTAGSSELRRAALTWLDQSRGISASAASLTEADVLPVIGAKEFVAFLPGMLGLGPGDVVVHPKIAYPTYDIGARLCGAAALAADSTTALGPGRAQLVWLNSPSNPTGRVLGIEHLTKVVQWARNRGAIVVSDECYAEFAWEEPWLTDGIPSILDPRVTGGSLDGILAIHSLSKRSNMAGYRAGFAMGDPKLISALLEIRKHAGMMVPGPVQAAMIAALLDDTHVAQQRERYRARRATLRSALLAAGYRVDHSEAGLYLWVTQEGAGDCWQLANQFAGLGILVTPGQFYGPGGSHHVRVALTAGDQAISDAAQRLKRA